MPSNSVGQGVFDNQELLQVPRHLSTSRTGPTQETREMRPALSFTEPAVQSRPTDKESQGCAGHNGFSLVRLVESGPETHVCGALL